MARKKNNLPKDVKISKGIARKRQLETGIIPVSKSWGGKPTIKQARTSIKKDLRSGKLER
jgi:hypothetical protein